MNKSAGRVGWSDPPSQTFTPNLQRLSMPSARVPTFTANADGRDFVVGDVHGCFRTLERALAELQFDPARDRLFGVGDLVNRGPHSNEAADWLEQRFTTVALGNHDRAALSWFEAKLRGSRIANDDWKGALDPSDYPRWRTALSQMPLALTVETPYGPVGVIHAEAPDSDWGRSVALLETGSETDIDDALLGFEQYTPAIRRMKSQPVQGLRALVSGHFVVEEVEVRANRWNLDTGAGFEDRNQLSFLEINARELTPLTFDVRETP